MDAQEHVAGVPAPLMTGEEGSFAHRTMTQRIPAIIQQTIEDNARDLTEAQQQALTQLREDILHNQPVPEPQTGSDRDRHCGWWREEWAKQTNHGTRGWLDIPWFFAEAYLYHVILDIVGFGSTGRDPFAASKRRELTKSSTWDLVQASLASTRGDSHDKSTVLSELLELCVWGNQADGCYQQVLQLQENGGGNSGLVIDERPKVCERLLLNLQQDGNAKIAVVTDNAGKELLMDLLLVDWLLRHDIAAAVQLHIKAAPTFVSDATREDVMETIDAVQHEGESHSSGSGSGSGEQSELSRFATRLRALIENGRLVLSPHQFWNSCLHFWDMPPELRQEVGTAAITILKGDANYRRLLGDSVSWDPCATMTEAAGFWPTPFVCLRTLKSDPIIGFASMDQVAALDAAFGFDWRVDGKRGVVQTGNF